MSCYYVGLDIHKASICIAVLNADISCAGTDVYKVRQREAWLQKLPEAGARTRAGRLFSALDHLSGLRRLYALWRDGTRFDPEAVRGGAGKLAGRRQAA